jgi:hypothetical protein
MSRKYEVSVTFDIVQSARKANRVALCLNAMYFVHLRQWNAIIKATKRGVMQCY